MQFGTPVIYQKKDGSQSKGYIKHAHEDSDGRINGSIVTVNERGEAGLPHVQMDGVRWKLQYGFKQPWHEPKPARTAEEEMEYADRHIRWY